MEEKVESVTSEGSLFAPTQTLPPYDQHDSNLVPFDKFRLITSEREGGAPKNTYLSQGRWEGDMGREEIKPNKNCICLLLVVVSI